MCAPAALVGVHSDTKSDKMKSYIRKANETSVVITDMMQYAAVQ